MKESRSERLSERLSDIDDELLDRAWAIDDAEKLKNYIKDQNKKPHYAAVFRRVAVIAACLVIAFGCVLAAPALLFQANSKGPTNGTQSNEPGNDAVPPWLRDDGEYLTIESIDMLNYYTAMRLLASNAKTNLYRTNEEDIMQLSVNTAVLSVEATDREKPYGFSIISDIGYDNDLQGEAAGAQGGTEKIYYYKLDPNEAFTVTSVLFFQIEIQNGDGFLASKLGTGTVDVVITENSLEPMITFKNGDRYYSCCENSLLDNGKLYSTHKYIEGFYIVKNLEQENYSFSVLYDNFNLDYRGASAKSVVCDSYKNGGTLPDGTMSVVSKTYVSNEGGEFTVRDLEEYFNSGKLPSGKLPEGSGSTALPPSVGETEKADMYVGGGYVFEFDPSGVFIYHGEESLYASYRKGTYAWHEKGLELLFYYEDELVEKAFCTLDGENGFVYNGTLYQRAP